MYDYADVNLYDVFEVWFSFYEKGHPTWAIKHKNTLSHFLGGYKGFIGNMQTWKLTPDGIQKAKMLLGPHARTIVKIYFHQHPELEKPPLL